MDKKNQKRNHSQHKQSKTEKAVDSVDSIAGQTSVIRETKQLMSLLANVSDKLNGQQSVNSETLLIHASEYD